VAPERELLICPSSRCSSACIKLRMRSLSPSLSGSAEVEVETPGNRKFILLCKAWAWAEEGKGREADEGGDGKKEDKGGASEARGQPADASPTLMLSISVLFHDSSAEPPSCGPEKVRRFHPLSSSSSATDRRLPPCEIVLPRSESELSVPCTDTSGPPPSMNGGKGWSIR